MINRSAREAQGLRQKHRLLRMKVTQTTSIGRKEPLTEGTINQNKGKCTDTLVIGAFCFAQGVSNRLEVVRAPRVFHAVAPLHTNRVKEVRNAPGQ